MDPKLFNIRRKAARWLALRKLYGSRLVAGRHTIESHHFAQLINIGEPSRTMQHQNQNARRPNPNVSLRAYDRLMFCLGPLTRKRLL